MIFKEYYFNDEGIMEDDEDKQNDEIDVSEEELNDTNTKAEINLKVSPQNSESEGKWETIDGITYYKYPDGTYATDWVTIDGVKCYFNELGQLIEKDASSITVY